MKPEKGEFLRKLCVVCGSGLILISLAILVGWNVLGHISQKQSAAYTELMVQSLPEIRDAMVEESGNAMMPTLTIEGIDFVGLLKFPKQDAVFPVPGAWEDRAVGPCRYAGSVYDKTLVIGANNQKGQIDFVKQIEVSDEILFVDMTGKQYSYQVTDIQYRKHADSETLYSEESDLTLFVKNIYGFEYIMIRCNL